VAIRWPRRLLSSRPVPHVQNELYVGGNVANFNELYNLNELYIFDNFKPCRKFRFILAYTLYEGIKFFILLPVMVNKDIQNKHVNARGNCITSFMRELERIEKE